MAAAVYRDPARWRDLALANDIPMPRRAAARAAAAAAEAAYDRAEQFRSPAGLWADYYAPEFVVRVDGRVVDPPPRATSSRSGRPSTSSSPASFSLTISDWDDVDLTFKYSSTKRSTPAG